VYGNTFRSCDTEKTLRDHHQKGVWRGVCSDPFLPRVGTPVGDAPGATTPEARGPFPTNQRFSRKASKPQRRKDANRASHQSCHARRRGERAMLSMVDVWKENSRGEDSVLIRDRKPLSFGPSRALDLRRSFSQQSPPSPLLICQVWGCFVNCSL
jgi:hypothetical protein